MKPEVPTPLADLLPKARAGGGPATAAWLSAAAPEPQPLFATAPPPVMIDEADAARQVEEAVAQARTEARAEGERKAWEAAEAEIAAAIGRLGDALGQIEGATRAMARPYATELVELALIVARELVGAEVQRDPAPLIHLVERCLEDVAGESSMTVRLHPADRAILLAARPDLVSEELHVVEDSSLARGGCVVESNRRLVDARLEQRLDNMREGLRELLKDAEHAAHG